MRAVAVGMLVLGLLGALGTLPTSEGWSPTDASIGRIRDLREGNPPGTYRQAWEDRQGRSTRWLAVWAGTALLGGVLLVGAPKKKEGP